MHQTDAPQAPSCSPPNPSPRRGARLRGPVARALGLAASAVLGVTLLLTGCGGAGSGTITVGCKDFPEQFILGEMMAQLIESHTDLKVQRRFNLGGTMVCHNALAQGNIDIYAEYTGTALVSILNEQVIPDPEAVFARVYQAYQEQFAVRWLEPFGFNNTYVLTVREDQAQQEGWETISDLRPDAADLQAGFTHEFVDRPDGLPGLRETYDMAFARVRSMSPTLMYQAAAEGQVDVICAFATDGRIEKYNLRTLDDDRGFFPPYVAAPIVREAVLEAHPELEQVLNRLAGALDDDTMRALNFEVDEHKRDAADVARDFLEREGLLATAQ